MKIGYAQIIRDVGTGVLGVAYNKPSFVIPNVQSHATSFLNLLKVIIPPIRGPYYPIYENP